MKNFLLLLCFLTCITSVAQPFSSHPIALTPTVFPDFKFNEDEYVSKLETRYKNDGDKNVVKEYANASLADKKYFFNSNEIYHNWPEATEFVKKVFYKTVPKNFTTENIKIFVIRSPDFNAYCMEDGNIMVTSGFLAFMNNEAELAATLSHEYGHFYCNHNFEGYKERKKAELKGINRSFFSSSRGYGDYYNHLRNAERTADTFAFNFVKKNSYCAQNILSDFENMKKIHLKYQSLKGYRKKSEYFSTHPSTEERIETTKKEIQKITVKGKPFQVDSMEFARIKKRAVDECIYLLFDELRFDECIELAFLQHLYYPQDEFYLYFLIESLHSQVKCVKYFKDVPFITCNYNLKKQKNNFNPVCYESKFNSYYESPDFRNSIFNRLKDVIFSLSDDDLSRIKAKELMSRDTIRFFTNGQALEYFGKKLKSTGPVFNMLRKQMNFPVEKNLTMAPTNSELENDLSQIYNHYLHFDSKWDSLEKGMFVLHRVSFYKNNGTALYYYENPEGEKKVYEDYKSFIKNRNFQDIIHEDKLNFRERSKIKFIANYIESINDQNFLGISTDMDFLNLCPEFVMQSVKNDLETIFLVKLRLMNFNTSFAFSGNYTFPKSSAIIYMIDIKNKRITIRTVTLGTLVGNSYSDEFEKIFLECESLIKN